MSKQQRYYWRQQAIAQGLEVPDSLNKRKRGRKPSANPSPSAKRKRASREARKASLGNQSATMSSLNPFSFFSPAQKKEQSPAQEKKEQPLSLEELKRLDFETQLNTQKQAAYRQTVKDETRKIDAERRLEEAKGRTIAEQTSLEVEKGRNLETQESIHLQRALDKSRDNLFGTSLEHAASADTHSTENSTITTDSSTASFDKDANWSRILTTQEAYNACLFMLIDQLQGMDRILARGYLMRYLCFGAESSFLEGLVSTGVTSEKIAVKQACNMLLCHPKDIQLTVRTYLEKFAAEVQQAKAKQTGPFVHVYYRKYREGALCLVKAQVLEAGFHFDSQGNASFDVAIRYDGQVVDTVMSRIQKAVHT